MAATAVNLTTSGPGAIEPDGNVLAKSYCPTCRRTTLRDARQMYRNRSVACSMPCFRRFRAFSRAHTLAKLSRAWVFENLPLYRVEDA